MFDPQLLLYLETLADPEKGRGAEGILCLLYILARTEGEAPEMTAASLRELTAVQLMSVSLAPLRARCMDILVAVKKQEAAGAGA